MTFSTRTVVAIGVDALPWIGLATGAVLFPSPALPNGAPVHPLWLPILILIGGGLFIAGRHRWAPLGPRDAQPPPPDPGQPAASRPRDSLPFLAPSSPPEQSRDVLPSLVDRAALLKTMTERLQESSSEAPSDGTASLALVTVRIAEYRDVTESFGHQAGQELLAAVASRIMDLSPSSATTAHTAEDTFAILLPEIEALPAEELGHDLLQSFDPPFDIGGHQIPIEASIGLAIRPSSDSPFGSAEKMLQASYSAMHRVQRQGGDDLEVYQNEGQHETRWLQRRERLREAIRRDELTLFYQPVVHLVSGATIGAEALVRWQHPERGLLSPAAFIPIAEETGLIEDLDRWVFHQALQHASRWTTMPDASLDWVSVNVSPQSLEGDFQNWGHEYLNEVSLPDGSLHLEVTERWALRDERSLQALREQGVRLSIDDFGTGYSSLRYLRSLNADTLKIDREFVQDLGRDEKTTAIVQFLMNLSLRLDVEVIAEGVEAAEQAEILRDLGCAMAQGYHFARPVPADTLAESILSNDRTPAGENMPRPG